MQKAETIAYTALRAAWFKSSKLSRILQDDAEHVRLGL